MLSLSAILSPASGTAQALPSAGPLKVSHKSVREQVGRQTVASGARPLGVTPAAPAPQKPGSAIRNAKAASIPELRGSVVYADGWTVQYNEMGMYKLPTSDAMEFERLGTHPVNATSGGTLVGDTYYATYFVDIYGSPFTYINLYDAENWSESRFLYAEPQHISTGMVYDRTTKTVYGCFRNDSGNGTGYVFGTIDYGKITAAMSNFPARHRKAIATLDAPWSAIAVDGRGQLYAIDETGKLLKVNKTNGSMTLVGETGLVATHPSSACIDPVSGRCFYALTSGEDGSLYEIDLATGAAELVYHFPGNQEVVGMYVPVPDVDIDAPSALEDFAVDFAGGSLSGSISFTMPQTTFVGDPIAGNLTYLVEAGGMTLAKASAAPGEKVTVNVTLPASAVYEISACAVNVFGNGPKSATTMFVGYDRPSAPEVEIAVDGEEVTLSWNKVETSINGGYVDFAAMSYNVTRLPDNVKVAENLRALSLVDRPNRSGNLTGYSYVVQAVTPLTSSDAVTSATVWLGAVTPPYSVLFNKPENHAPFTVINANGDGSEWSWGQYDNSLRVPFSRDCDQDDWLVTPALRLEKGKVYEFTATLRTYLGNPERAEIRWGSAPTAEAMTNVLMEPTTLKCREAEDFTGYIVPQADGLYYVGIHCITESAESWYLFADGISVSAGTEAIIPDAPGLAVVPDPSGALKAQVTVTAPDKDVNGNAVEGLLRLDVLRDGVRIGSFPSPEAGKAYTVDDEVPSDGYYKYEAFAYNSYGAGVHASVTSFVGANEPAKVAYANIRETENIGEVEVSWAAVTTDKDGNPMNPDLISYSLITADDEGNAYYAAENVKGTSVRVKAVYPGEPQRFVFFGVQAVSSTGSSLNTFTPFIPVGEPAAAPYAESFAGGTITQLFRTEDSAGVWSLFTDESGIPAQDGDNGFLGMAGANINASGSIYSGKVSLAGLANPVLSLYAYNIKGQNPDLNELEISISTGDGFSAVATAVMDNLGAEDGWYRVQLPLSAYAGKSVQLALKAVNKTNAYTLVDNIRIYDALASNVSVDGIAAPAKVAPDQEFAVTGSLSNPGLEAAKNVKLELLEGDRVVATQQIDELAAGSSAIFSFPLSLNVTAADEQNYRVRAVFADDMDETDNLSAVATVFLIQTLHPVPADLTGEVTSEGVRLRWTAPDPSAGVPDPVTDDFEGYASWAKENVGDWTFVDVDCEGIGAIENVVMPGIDYNSQQSYFVFDNTSVNMGNTFVAHSGNKYLSTIFVLQRPMELVPNDDWAVSPLLYGGEQTISFYARSVNEYEVAESFQVLATDAPYASVDQFELIEDIEYVPGEWTRYEFDLPAGTRHFAIRYNKTFGIMLHVDDVTFIPDGKSNLVLEGYHVYRDGKRLTSELCTTETYLDTTHPGEGKATYTVSAHYGKDGESRPSEALLVDLTGVENVIAGASGTTLAVEGSLLVARSSAPADLTVTDTLGRTVATATVSGELRLPLPAGIYLARLGDALLKFRLP